MTLSPSELKELCQCAINAATKAGRLIAHRSKEHFVVNKKTGGSSFASQVFTEVDIASERLIIETLQPTIDKYNLALLSEETTDDKSRFEKDYFWCIDPLDGTLPFIEQTTGYSVSIALVDRTGHPLIGVIYNPIDSTVYHAIDRIGAYKNGYKWILNEPTNELTLVCDRSFLKQEALENISNKLEIKNGIKPAIISHGGAAMNAVWVLENHPAIYFKYPKKENGGGSVWDFAASACIYNELGAYAQSFNGEALDLNRKDSTFMNHKGIFYASDAALINKFKHLL
ncbi:3'(2'),5'-bisphosphate nucleotidase CysQ family protein [Carboxylicivirga marina]|uniref:3'(2'),5'-bisphosphate nucleotidase CysQ family protein n=1 Tax=Carboxylicivirga marina TaxID=2800988 RepID=UPI002593DDA3|nr:inositol monophosphatase family protein [uncultured Carboxylicivirga sp.]